MTSPTPSRHHLWLPLAALIIVAFSARAEQVIFTEIHYNPRPGQPEFIEISNNTATPFDMGKWYFSDGVSYTFPDFNPGNSSAHILRAFERILVTDVTEASLRAAYSIPATTRVFGPYTGALSNAGETLTLCNKNGTVMATLTYNDSGKWPAAPDGTGHTLTRINPNFVGGEWRNWTSSASPNGTPGTGLASVEGQTAQITTTTSTWKYDQNSANNNLGTAWREPAFDDTAWAEGPGVFGKDSADRGFQTPWTTGGRVTYYVRKQFQWNSAFSGATINVQALLDDGAVVYLNGQEVGRQNMPVGTIAYDTPAATSAEADALVAVATNADITSALRVGTNVLAVEVHNNAAGSSDIVFGAEVSITAIPQDLSSILVLSEIHFGNNGRVDWVELHAPGNSAVGTNGFTLSSLTDLSNATPLSGPVPAGGYLSFNVDFPVEANGDINLFLALGTTIIDAHKFDRDRGEESFQSLPVGKEFYGGPGHTRDAANAPSARHTEIIINEIMFDTPSDQKTGEFIELYNRGASAIDLSNWNFTDGIAFTFPSGTTLAPGGYLVVAADTACLGAAHGGITILGNWSGSLSDSGELLRLEDANGNLADEVDYLPGGDWPNLADGDGSSMELRHPDMDNNVASAWADSDESQKATMQNFTYTANFERATWNPLTGAQELHTNLVGDAHVILKSVSLKRNNTGANLISNPNVMSPDNLSSKGWVTQGTHWASFMDGDELHLISDGHGDNKANRGEIDIAALVFDNSYTLSFEARWVSGKSRLIFQTLDHGFGTTFLLPIPENLGTPGAPNSTRVASAAPTISGLIHSPAVPAPTTPVKVSARVASSAALGSVELVHRLDNNTGSNPWLRTSMTDDGTGLYSATLSQYNTQGNIVQFYVEAKAGAVSTTQPKYGAARPAMWIADNRTMPDTLLRERFVISEYDRAALTTSIGHSPTFAYNFPRASNHFFNCTFIANESEVFYNAEIRKSGSPFTRSSDANIDHGKWKLPGDRLFRGRHRSVIDASGTAEGSGTPRFYDDRIARYFLYQLGLPTNEMEYVHSVVNTLPFKLRENQEPIANDMLDRNFADGSEGTLLRIDDEWRFTSDDGDSREARDADWSYKNSDNPIRYHSEWIMRSRESDYDYSNFIEFVRTLQGNSFDEATINRLADADMLCISAAVRGYDADWDTITVNRGKNAYFYRPKDGKGWMLLHWDGDRVFETPYDRPIIGGRPGIGTYFNQPYIKRRLNYYLTKLLDEHTKGSARTQAWMQAETDAVAGTGITMTASHYTSWFANRESYARSFVGATVNNTAFAITTGNAPTASNTLNLAGNAPPNLYAIQVAGQPAAQFRWTSTTNWTLNGILLHAGTNVLDVQGIDHDGNIVTQAQFTVTKTNNAPPVAVLAASPKSLNVSLGETFQLDASGSNDPEGSPLSFAWQVNPVAGVNLVPSGPLATATFSRAGVYQFTLTVTDDQPQSTTRTVSVAAYGPAGFATFGNTTLEDYWQLFRIGKHGNSPTTANYSLQDYSGRLTIDIPLGAAVPLGLPQLPLPTPVRYIDLGDVWKYDDTNNDLTAVFAQSGFDDTAWMAGPGFLGFNETGLPTPPGPDINTTLARDIPNNLVTYYFRRQFQFTADPVGSRITIDHLVDDGVRYYLNGQVLGNVRLSPGTIDSKTPASPLPVEDVIEEDVIDVDGSAFLVNGTNVLAAEVHNAGSGSSDLVYGMRLDIAARPLGNGAPALDDVLHPWIRRSLPSTADWTLQTEVKLERTQFGAYFAGLLVQAQQGGNPFRYGIGFKDGTAVAALRVNPSGTSEILASLPNVAGNTITVRIQRHGDQLAFSWRNGDTYVTVHQLTLPAGTSFDLGGVFASTETAQSLTASFDYAMLVDTTPVAPVPLVVSEIMYHPVNGSTLEFIELYNAGATPLDLAGFRTVQDEPVGAFTFPAFILRPGAYGLLVADQATFTATYGAGLTPKIIGQWPSGNLGNSGDTLTLTDATGALVTSFTYDDAAPWPTAPDGEGPSLVLIDPASRPDHGLATSWRASTFDGGSPGAAEPSGGTFAQWMLANGFTDPNADPDGNGLNHLLDYYLGADLTAASVHPSPITYNGDPGFSFRRRVDASEVEGVVEISTDLKTWSSNPADVVQSGEGLDNSDGTITEAYQAVSPTSPQYFRLRVTLQP